MNCDQQLHLHASLGAKSKFLLGFHQYIDEAMPPESPYLYGLHPNAEIGFLTTTSDNLFRTVFEMQPRDAGASGGSSVTREDKVSSTNFYGKLHIFKN